MGDVKHNAATVHPSPAELAEFACGALDDVRVAVIEGHVYRCDRCAERVADAGADAFINQLRAARQESAALRSDGDASLADTVGMLVAEATQTDLVALGGHERFRVKGLLAEGSRGRVYLAWDRSAKNWVAVKVLKPELASNPRQSARFRREALLSGKLRHPHIAHIVESGTTNGAAYLAVEFVVGKTLAQIVSQRGPLPVAEACGLIRQACLGLQCAADQGVVHRDLKPRNLMATADGTIKILDFGLGRLVDDQRTGTGVTREGDVLGISHYLAPEQAADAQRADVRSDIYSLGCTFYFLLAGEPPFRGRHAKDVSQMHATAPTPSILALRRDVPPAIAELILRMLEKDPRRRPQTPRDIVAALDAERRPPANQRRVPHGRVGREGRSSTFAWFELVATPAVFLPIVTFLFCILWYFLR